ncbi:MAG: hypothetical protein AAGF31_03865 [Planctomycetota bacterium]
MNCQSRSAFAGSWLPFALGSLILVAGSSAALAAPADYSATYSPPMGTHAAVGMPLPAAPYAGLYNHAHAAPPFRWGWFGAEYFSPPVKRHKGYYGQPYRWSRHRQY